MQRVVVAVDDDPAILASVAETLEFEGIKVVTFKSALPALSWLVDNPTDLIIVDFVMPRMNGYHFMRVLEARQLAPQAHAQRAEQIAETNSIESVYRLFSEVLYSTLSEEFVESFLILSDRTEKD